MSLFPSCRFLLNTRGVAPVAFFGAPFDISSFFILNIKEFPFGPTDTRRLSRSFQRRCVARADPCAPPFEITSFVPTLLSFFQSVNSLAYTVPCPLQVTSRRVPSVSSQNDSSPRNSHHGISPPHVTVPVSPTPRSLPQVQATVVLSLSCYTVYSPPVACAN